MKKIVLLYVFLVSAVLVTGCKGGDAPANDASASDVSADRKKTVSSGKIVKGAPGYGREAVEAGLRAAERMAANVKRLPRETRETIVKQTVESLRKVGKYLDEDLKYFEKKLRVVYGL